MTLGVQEGKFLGYLITIRGIEANPEKIRDIDEITKLKIMKDTQKLIDQLVA